MRFWRWGSARLTATGFGLVYLVVGVCMAFNVAETRPADNSPAIGVVVAVLGFFILAASAWLARRRPDESPWDARLDGDLHGGL
jgi:hypothetical protein